MERATRYSRKREAILNAIQSTDCHPSAEWVYQTLKPTHPRPEPGYGLSQPSPVPTAGA